MKKNYINLIDRDSVQNFIVAIMDAARLPYGYLIFNNIHNFLVKLFRPKNLFLIFPRVIHPSGGRKPSFAATKLVELY